MNFTVVWRPSAEERLAEVWLDAADRQGIADAANTIDAILRKRPTEVGESRVTHNVRILTVSPLSIYYDVHEQDCLVAVSAGWRSRAE
jgi:plasmid stabilization system protein ParE